MHLAADCWAAWSAGGGTLLVRQVGSTNNETSAHGHEREDQEDFVGRALADWQRDGRRAEYAVVGMGRPMGLAVGTGRAVCGCGLCRAVTRHHRARLWSCTAGPRGAHAFRHSGSGRAAGGARILPGAGADTGAWATWTLWAAPLLFGLVGLGFVASYLADGREGWKLPAGAARLTLALAGVAVQASPFLAGFVYVIGLRVTVGLVLAGHNSGAQPTEAGGQPAAHG